MNILVIPSWYPDSKKSNWAFGQIGGSFFKEQALELNRKVNVQIAYVRIHSLRKFKIRNLFRLISISWSNEDGIFTARLNTYNFFPGSSKALIFQYLVYSKLLFVFLHLSKNFLKPDIIHCHSPFFAGVVAMYASKKFNAKLIFTEHSRQHPEYILPEENYLYKKIIKASTKVIALSNDFKKFLTNDQNVPDKKISLVPNMIPRYCLDIPANKTVNGGIFTFIFVGILLDLKRPIDLLMSFSMIEHEKYPCRLKMIGSGPLFEKCNEFILKNNLKDKATLLGEQSRENTIMNISKSNCLCSVSSTESFGLTILEAQSLGIPVISSRSGGPQDLINNKNGILVNVGNTYELKDAMTKMIINQDNYVQNDIKEACIKKYHPDVVTSKLLSIYGCS